MMTESQGKAWSCLTQIEQKSLFLQIVQGKTSWETGEILKIAHYKYLELKERSQKFFRMFTEYFDKYSALINPMSPIKDTFRDYLEAAIEKRYDKKKARGYTGDSAQLIPKINEKVILRNMARLKHSTSQWDKDLYELILEFDRWNTHRILPNEIQLISPYRRRVNKRHKIYLRWIMRTKPFVVKRVKEKFASRAEKKIYWVCLTSWAEYGSKGYEVIKVNQDSNMKKELTRLNIYIWNTREEAEAFGVMASLFIPKTGTIKTGQKFWPKYHELVTKAVNFKDINNISYTISRLDMSHDNYR